MADKTSAKRQAARTRKLNEIAQRAGYKSWRIFETEVIHKRAGIEKAPQHGPGDNK